MPSRNDIEDVTGVGDTQVVVQGKLPRSHISDEKLIIDVSINGQLPVWASNQLQQALDQLFRTNLIR